MSFRQSEPRATRTRELCSNRRSNLFKMFRLHVVPLNMTCEVYVMLTEGSISEKTRDVSACLPWAYRGAQYEKRRLCHSDKRRNLRKNKRCFGLFTLSLSKGSIGQRAI